jgi:16S rRNA (adenine1518-N6/adenine1519-N6)-dimethyltransferase
MTYYVKPKKHLGQHFLIDRNIAEKIASLVRNENPLNILEIGPGKGILTQFLVDIPSDTFKCIEIDSESVEWLKLNKVVLPDAIIESDFLRYDIDSLFSGNYALIGNFPYNISSQILFVMIEHSKRIPLLVGMFQKEVAERIAAPHGSKTYGILSVLVQALYHAEIMFIVNENVFQPPPKVKSAVIRLKQKTFEETKDIDFPFLASVVKTAFGQRRKMLRNTLAQFRIQDFSE